MKIRLSVVSLAALMLAAVLPMAARASEWDRKTIVTLSDPVEVPGRVLPAGTYVFKLVDSEANLVQIFDKSEDRIVATLFTIREEATKTPTTPIINLSESKNGAPEEIRSWFFAGENSGVEFVYPQTTTHMAMLARVKHAMHLSL